MEAAFGLLMGASRWECASHTGVAPSTVSKIADALKNEFKLEIKKRLFGPGIPIPLVPAEREFVRKAAEKAGSSVGAWLHQVAMDAAAEVLGEKAPANPRVAFDWRKVDAVLLEDGGARPPERPATPPAAAPTPRTDAEPPKAAAAATAATRPPIQVPRDPDVGARATRRDRRDLLRERFKSMNST